MSNDITRWISDTIIESDTTWLALVFRVDGTVQFANKTKKSVWAQGCVSAFENTKCVLSWTITECRRKYDRKMRFAGFVGGEPTIGVFPHIHALIELPQHTTPEEIVEYLASLWSRKLKKKLKQSVKSSVKYEVMRGANEFSSYCSRNEGSTFSLGDEKLILNNSFFLYEETLPKLL
jgi:hypothetical protein